MLLVFCLFVSILIIAITYIKNSSTYKNIGISNPDLELFFSLSDESPAIQMKQLIKAAATNLNNAEIIARQLDTSQGLYNDKVIGDDYCSSLKSLEEELVIEKICIESEAEVLKPGAKDVIFGEANRHRLSEKSLNKKRKYFDEILYLKRKELLMRDLKTRLGVAI